LDILLTKKRDKKAAVKYFKKLLKGQRQQQRQMRQFVSMAQAQRFLSFHGIINNHFRQQRHLLKAKYYRTFRDRAFSQWAEVTMSFSDSCDQITA